MTLSLCLHVRESGKTNFDITTEGLTPAQQAAIVGGLAFLPVWTEDFLRGALAAPAVPPTPPAPPVNKEPTAQPEANPVPTPEEMDAEVRNTIHSLAANIKETSAEQPPTPAPVSEMTRAYDGTESRKAAEPQPAVVPVPAAPIDYRKAAQAVVVASPPEVLPAVRELLKSFGAVRLSDLADDKLPCFVEKLEKLTGGKS
jgi:hypothetical protein